ncbi:MAG: AI-2E family transporter [Pseudomonadota bacterium]
MNYISGWFRRQFSNPQVVILSIVLLTIAGVIWLVGDTLAPLFAAIVIAYLLQGLVARLQRLGLPHLPSVIVAFVTFLLIFLFAALRILPTFVRQLTQLFQQTPAIVDAAKRLLLRLPEMYPNFITTQQVNDYVASLGAELVSAGQPLISYSVSSLVGFFTGVVYLILVPFLVFFLVRDKESILDWFVSFLPSERELTNRVWDEVNGQISNYVRGKVWEIFIVGAATFFVFTMMDVQYALFLSVLTGVSVLIPYVGAALVTVPVAAVGLFQWGLSGEFYTLLVAYGVIQALDGNLLAPLLFSEVVNLHPVAIITAILVFGGLWGVWGVFFAIPLATVINAVLGAWPKATADEAVTSEPELADGAAVEGG